MVSHVIVRREREAMMELWQGGVPLNAIARRFKVPVSTVYSRIRTHPRYQPTRARPTSRSARMLDLEEQERRREVMVEAFLGGETTTQIGDRFGVSKERVRQILFDDPRYAAELAARSRAARLREVARRLRELLADEGGQALTRAELAAVVGEPYEFVARAISADPGFPVELIASAHNPRSDQELLVSLRRVWQTAQEREPGIRGLSVAVYLRYRDPERDAGASWMCRRFGGWIEATRQAGIPHGVAGGRPGGMSS